MALDHLGKGTSRPIVLRLEQVEFAYSPGEPVLKGIDLVVQAGEKLAVVGPNGAGKSTLLTLLNGTRRCKGRIWIEGMPLRPDTVREIRRRVGLVFQNPDDQLFCPTIEEDVAFGPLNLGLPREEVAHRIAEALKAVGMDTRRTRHPLHLSYGEKKLVALATVLAMRPAIIALDEPTSNLDPAHRRRLIRWMQQSTATLILATHDLDMVLEVCSQVVLLDNGQIVARGRPDSLLRDQALLEAHGLELPLCWQMGFTTEGK
ncbi:MAG: ABC transporter ATP-binding protein [Calditrichaeota bacterium]|nr:ABC transporter ATP-binding protein [Calditrichota bacterium]